MSDFDWVALASVGVVLVLFVGVIGGVGGIFGSPFSGDNEQEHEIDDGSATENESSGEWVPEYTNASAYNDGDVGPSIETEYTEIGEFESGNGVLACDVDTTPEFPANYSEYPAAHTEYVELSVAPVLLDGEAVAGRYIVADEPTLSQLRQGRRHVEGPTVENGTEWYWSSNFDLVIAYSITDNHYELVAEQVDEAFVYWSDVNDDGEIVRYYTKICLDTATGDSE